MRKKQLCTWLLKKNNLQVVKLLLENKNIDVNIENEKGQKPIDLATDKKIIDLFN